MVAISVLAIAPRKLAIASSVLPIAVSVFAIALRKFALDFSVLAVAARYYWDLAYKLPQIHQRLRDT